MLMREPVFNLEDMLSKWGYRTRGSTRISLTNIHATVTLAKKALQQDLRVMEDGIKLENKLAIAKGIKQKKEAQTFLLSPETG